MKVDSEKSAICLCQLTLYMYMYSRLRGLSPPLLSLNLRYSMLYAAAVGVTADFIAVCASVFSAAYTIAVCPTDAVFEDSAEGFKYLLALFYGPAT